jgi:hypothetical protein
VIADVSNYDANPTVAKWRAEVEAKGGRSLAVGYPFPPNKGAPTAMWNDPSKPGGRRYELAPLSVRLAVGYEKGKDVVTLRAGAAAEKAENIVGATGLNKGVLGVVGKLLGIPHGAVVAIAVAAGALIGYGALVNIGILPPLKSWVGK